MNNSAKSKSITKGFRPYDESNNDLEEEFTESFEMTDSQFEDNSDKDTSEEDYNIKENFQSAKSTELLDYEIDPTEEIRIAVRLSNCLVE